MIKSVLLISCLLFTGFSSCSSKNYFKTNSKSINADELINLINDGKDIYEENMTIEGAMDFTKLKKTNEESKTIHRINISSSLTFVHCIFTGKITAYSADDTKTNLVTFRKNVTCIECEFKDEVTLQECDFNAIANFSSSSFLKKTSFEGSNFFTDAFFTKSSFSDEARFQNVTFHNKANFMESIYGKTVSFQSAGFSADAQFSVAKFLGYADFSVASFSTGCFFNYAEFSNQAIFSNAVFKGRAEFFKGIFSGNTEFKACVFYNLSKWNEATINTSFSFQNATFIFAKPDLSKLKKTDQTKMNFENAKVATMIPLTEKDF